MEYPLTLNNDELFEAVWREEFLPLIAEKRRVRTEQQTEAFLDTTLTLCGEEVRQMTPDDLLMLDPLDTRNALGIAISAALNTPIAELGFFGAAIRPSRWARFRASLRARRTASAF